MTNQPSMESSLAARIQKIAADLQSGVLPSTTENIMHLMGLKSDLEKARSARSAQMLMQPKAPTVKDQLLVGAQQEAGIASLPEYADGGVIGLAGGTGQSMREQLQRLLAEQEAAQYASEYGWTPEAVESYQSPYNAELRKSMSRRYPAATQQPVSLEDLKLAQAKARAQTGLGIRAQDVIEMPPFKEQVNIPPKPEYNPLQATRGTSFGAAPDYLYSEYIPGERTAPTGLPKFGNVYEGASFAHPTSTPKADAAFAQAEYAERVGPPRGAAMGSKEAQAYLRDPSFVGQGREFVGPTEGAIPPSTITPSIGKSLLRGAGTTIGKSLLRGAGTTIGALSIPSMIDAMTGSGDPAEAERGRILANIFKQKGAKGVIEFENSEAGKNLAAMKQGVTSGLSKAYESVATPMSKFWYGEEGAPQQYDAYAGVESPTRPQQPTTQQPSTRQQVEAEAAKDMMQQQAKKTQGELAGKPGVGSFVVAPKEKTATQALIEEATRDTSAQPAAPAMPAIPSLQSGMEEWQKAVGENKGIGATEERLRKLEAGTADTKDRALWEGLMMAGLQRAGGANWGQAGMAGLGTWSEAQKEARKQEEKYFTIQNELEQAKRNEIIQAAQYGGKARENALQRAAELEKVQFRAAAEMKQAEMSAKANMSVAQIYANRPTGGAGSLAEEKHALALRKYETAMLNSAIDDTRSRMAALEKTIGFAKNPEYVKLKEYLNNLNAQRAAMMSDAPTPSPADQPGQKLSEEQRAAMEKSVQAKLLR